MILFNIIYDITLEERVVKINEGTENRDCFIEEYIPFIIKIVTGVTNYYIENINSEEYSLGLIAFNDAIDTFSIDKGKFLSYAKHVIRNRIIDFLRKKRIDTLNISDIRIPEKSNLEASVLLKIEIDAYIEVMKEYKLSVDKLMSKSPKHKDTRIRCFEISKQIFRDEKILEKIKINKKLPLKELSLKYGISHKVLKGNKEFILSLIILNIHDLRGILEFLELDR
jgi:RNA polymerase sigma factor